MTSKERMFTAYKHEEPDRVPISPEIWNAMSVAVSGKPFYKVQGPFADEPFYKYHIQAYEYFGCDGWIIEGPSVRDDSRVKKESKFIDKNTIETVTIYQGRRGRTLRSIDRTTELYTGWLKEHPVKKFPEGMETYKEFFFRDLEDYDTGGIEQAIEHVGERGLVTPGVGGLFTSFLGGAREGGMSQAIYDIYDYEAYCRELQNMYIKHLCRLAEFMIEKTEPEVIFLNSDYSAPPIVSPEMYSKWDKPVIEAVAKVAKRYGVLLHIHQHGHLMKVIEQIIDAGADIVCPLIPPPQGDVNDLGELKKKYGSRIALKGYVDPIKFLLHGSQQEIEAEVRGAIHSAAKGGGYVLGSADGIVFGTPFSNIRAFVETGKKYGKYPMRC